ncbi:MAG: DUF4214 domain-containing protein, partial [Nitrosopumilaceae archaeon]
LHREPDEEGFNYFMNLFQKKELDEKTLIDMMKNSNEYIIRKCYLEILHREIKAGGYEYYLDLMKGNVSDEKKLIMIIKNSEEYKRFEFRKKFTKKHQELPVYGLTDL